MIRVVIFLSIFVSLFSCEGVSSVNTNNQPETKPLLVNLLGNSISFEHTADANIVKYCPENTCDVIITEDTRPSAFSKLLDFSFLYFYYVSGYDALKDFKIAGQDYAPAIVDRNAVICPDSSEIDRAKCTLRELTREYSIRIIFVRYDEKQRHEAVIDLDAELERLKSN
jgi:hypothetical protein